MTEQAPLGPSDYINHLVIGFATSEPRLRFVRSLRSEPGIYALGDVPTAYAVHHPALLDQLENTLTASTTAGESVRAVAGSRPAGRMDVLSFLERLNAESKSLAADHDIPALPLRPRLRRIGGELGIRPNRVVRGWWVTARILTSFDSPAFTPNVPCPNEACERRGSLRVKVAQRSTDCMAVCVECHQVWDGVHFGVFAEWIRWASEHLSSRHLCDECITVREAMLARKDARALLASNSRLQSSCR